jgi:hypothetical protein
MVTNPVPVYYRAKDRLQADIRSGLKLNQTDP